MHLEKIKRIVVREGSVLLAVLLFSGILLWAHKLISYNENDSSYIYFCSTGGKKYAVELEDDKYSFSEEGGHTIFTALKIKYPKDFSADKGLRYRIPADFRIDYVKVKFALPGQIKSSVFNLSLSLLLIAYPVYLIFRFIGWAIRLLIED